jgi:hypothetical protein
VLYNDLVLEQSEINQLTRSVRDRYIKGYQDFLTQALSKAGCSGVGKRPTGRDLTAINNMVSRDVDSIVNTFNLGAQGLVRRLTNQHPDWSRTQYRAAMNDWQENRLSGKNNQIILASKTNAAEYARQRFINENELDAGLWVWDASPPIVFNSHAECIRRVRLGGVPWSVAEGWQKTHPNCRHAKVRQAAFVLNCETVWRG